jgi:hypothetical protein
MLLLLMISPGARPRVTTPFISVHLCRNLTHHDNIPHKSKSNHVNKRLGGISILSCVLGHVDTFITGVNHVAPGNRSSGASMFRGRFSRSDPVHYYPFGMRVAYKQAA